jgi:6-carboxyhexanoate--CoA ligase
VVQEYIDRAKNHPKGKPDHIVITVEKIRQKPKTISTLPVATLKCASPKMASASMRNLLSSAGLFGEAIDAAFTVIRSKNTMRGAALVLANSGLRVEPDKDRGIRASRLGITKKADAVLSAALDRHGLSTQTVKEALILASKVAACRGIIAELCVSDDPDYTTGYVASKKLGYVRIPHVKVKGSRDGGRVFFLSDTASIPAVIRFLERKSVIINDVSPCHGMQPIDELSDRHNQ